MPWFRSLSAQERAWVSLVAGAGITAFVDWYSKDDVVSAESLTAEVFAAAPRELASTITLQQTVEMVRATIAVVEENVENLAPEDQRSDLRQQLLLYSREIAFAAAEVYAQAAESRGAWDARLEALLIDALLRDEFDDNATSQAAALGWSASTNVVAIAGYALEGRTEASMELIRRAAAHHQLDLLTGVHGEVVLAVIGGVDDPWRVARLVSPHFGDGPVVIGSVVTGLANASTSARQALSGLSAAAGWPDAPRPVLAADLLPERALAGDPTAIHELTEAVYRALERADPSLLLTASTYLERSSSLEACARTLYVHPNTIRYRLRRIADVTGRNPTDSRDALILRTGLILGRLGGESSTISPSL